MLKCLLVIHLILISVFFLSCDRGDNSSSNNNPSGDKNNFVWKEIINTKDIPEFDIKGYVNGKEVKIVYINFEKWRGNGDNVLNFGTRLPEQTCGAVDNDTAFHLMRPSRDFETGEFLKENFNKDVDGYVADFHIYEGNEPKKISVPWNCALFVEQIGEKTVKGKIALCFKDETKSWIAGKFEAVRCNN